MNWCNVVVVNAHDSVHLACIQCSANSCGRAVEVISLARWASGLSDFSCFGVALRIASCSRWLL